MTQRLPNTDKNDEGGLNWPRIAGMTFVIGVHAAALMLLLAPVTPPGMEKTDTEVTRVVVIEPPPPPPPPPPPTPPKEIKLTPQPNPPPRPTPPQPPPPEPPVVMDNPTPMSLPPTPPAPPAPPAPVAPTRNTNDLRASLCSKPSMTPIQLAISKAQEGGTTVVTLQFTADGTVTSATVGQSSHNRDLDRAAVSWARQVKLCPGSAGSGSLPIVMNL